MSDDKNYNIVRCPRCGGNQLKAVCDTSADKKAGRGILMWGIFGLISALRKKKNNTYWQCLNCGHTFPME